MRARSLISIEQLKRDQNMQKETCEEKKRPAEKTYEGEAID